MKKSQAKGLLYLSDNNKMREQLTLAEKMENHTHGRCPMEMMSEIKGEYICYRYGEQCRHPASTRINCSDWREYILRTKMYQGAR